MFQQRAVRKVLGAAVTCVFAGVALAGCTTVKSAQGGADDSVGVDTKTKTITIGTSAPKTGSQVSFYENVQAAQAALGAVNAAGGVNGWKIKYTVLDDAYNPSTALSNVRELVEQDKVFAIVTSVGTPTVSAELPYLANTDVPDIGIIAEAGLLSGKYSSAPNIFSVVPAYGRVSAFIVDYLASQKHVNKISLMYQDDQSGAAVVPGVTAEARKKGVTVAASAAVPDTATDFSGYAAKLKAGGAPEVVAWGPPPMVAGVMNASAAIGYKPHWLAPFFVPGSAFFKLVGPLANNMEFESWFTPLTSDSPGVKAFLAAMKKYTTDPSPSTTAEGGWISMYEFVYGLEAATKGGKVPTRSALVAALNTGKAFEPGNVGASFSYTTQQRIPSSVDSILTYKNGSLVTTYGPRPDPTDLSKSDIR
ncbi:MAG: ABC transporter substrate-binding protein [Nocardiopsaceae bacterium]|nr:ABC transporter substrate-binding protein [Nocardiopsaceae bacterium]